MPYRILKMTRLSLHDEVVRTKQRAMEIAQAHCRTKSDSAEIVRLARGEETTIMRYWRDSEGLQYITY
jgi:hypothetical protein